MPSSGKRFPVLPLVHNEWQYIGIRPLGPPARLAAVPGNVHFQDFEQLQKLGALFQHLEDLHFYS